MGCRPVPGFREEISLPAHLCATGRVGEQDRSGDIAVMPPPQMTGLNILATNIPLDAYTAAAAREAAAAAAVAAWTDGAKVRAQARRAQTCCHSRFPAHGRFMRAHGMCPCETHGFIRQLCRWAHPRVQAGLSCVGPWQCNSCECTAEWDCSDVPKHRPVFENRSRRSSMIRGARHASGMG